MLDVYFRLHSFICNNIKYLKVLTDYYSFMFSILYALFFCPLCGSTCFGLATSLCFLFTLAPWVVFNKLLIMVNFWRSPATNAFSQTLDEQCHYTCPHELCWFWPYLCVWLGATLWLINVAIISLVRAWAWHLSIVYSIRDFAIACADFLVFCGACVGVLWAISDYFLSFYIFCHKKHFGAIHWPDSMTMHNVNETIVCSGYWWLFFFVFLLA